MLLLDEFSSRRDFQESKSVCVGGVIQVMMIRRGWKLAGGEWGWKVDLLVGLLKREGVSFN